MPMPSWRSILPVAIPVLFLCGLIGWALYPRPTLQGAVDQLARGDYDGVETRLLAYLNGRHSQENERVARLLLARASVDRPDPKPELALEQVSRIVPPDNLWAAQVKAVEGLAHYQQNRFRLAEAAWLEALQLDPLVAEVGWGILNLYALQGRDDDARRLGLRLFEVEPNPHDRVQLLLQLVRHDAHAIAPDGVVTQLEPVHRNDPDDLPTALALGRALIRDSQFDRGLSLLQELLAAHPEDPNVWEAYLSAFVEAGRIEDLAQALDRLPDSLADDSRFAATRGWLASQRQDWTTAAEALLAAWKERPSDAILAYRLLQALRAAGREKEMAELGPALEAIGPARDRLRELWDQIDALPNLGQPGYEPLYRQMATTLEQLDRPEEARAWLSLAERQASAIPTRRSSSGSLDSNRALP